MIYHTAFSFDVCTYGACQIFALMVVIKSGINFVWLMYLVACQKEFISKRLINICSVECNSYKCGIDTLLILPKLS